MISNIDKSEAIPMLFIPSVEQTAMKTLKRNMHFIFIYHIVKRNVIFAQFQLQGLQMKWS